MIYIYVDAGFKNGYASYGFTFQGGDKGPLYFARGGVTNAKTNNTAEYVALYRALKEALSRGKDEVVVRMDSELVVKQLNGEYEVRDKKLIELYRQIWELIRKFRRISFEHVPREQNKIAHGLAADALDELLESLPKEEKEEPKAKPKQRGSGGSKRKQTKSRKAGNKSR